MRTREKLTLEEKFALALELIKRERCLDEIRSHYRVSHTTAYKIRNAFLEGGRAALNGELRGRSTRDLEARIQALEDLFENGRGNGDRKLSSPAKPTAAVVTSEDRAVQERRAGK